MATKYFGNPTPSCVSWRDASSRISGRKIRAKPKTVRWFSWGLQYITKDGGTLYFEHIIKKRFGAGPPVPQAVERATAGFRRYGKVLNDYLDGRRYLLGDALTVADFAVAVTLPYAEQAHIPLDELPNVRRWHDRLSELEAWREPFPARPSVNA